MINFRMMLLSTAAIGLTTVAAVSSSSAADVEKKVAWSGQVNRAIVSGTDGEESFFTHTDGHASGSRLRIKASAKSDAMEIGTYQEFGFQSQAKSSQNAAGSDSFAIRHSMLYMKNSMGKFDFGQTSHAGESFVMLDVSGTTVASGPTATPLDGLKFNNAGSLDGSQAAGTTVGTAHGSGYGAGRSNGMSYTTPGLNGFGVKVSHRTDASGSYEATYGGDFNGMKIKAGYSYANIAGGTYEDKHGGGIGVTLPSGLNLSANWRTATYESPANTANNSDPETYYGKVGYTLSGVSDLGATNVAIEYRATEDQSQTGDDFKSVAFLFTQSLSDYGTSVYGGYSNMSYDTEASDFDDINAFWLGARVTF
jgi:hypothetical protein